LAKRGMSELKTEVTVAVDFVKARVKAMKKADKGIIPKQQKHYKNGKRNPLIRTGKKTQSTTVTKFKN